MDGAEAFEALVEVFGAAFEGVVGEDEAGAVFFGVFLDGVAVGFGFFPGDAFDVDVLGAGFHGGFPEGDAFLVGFLGEAAFPGGADGDDDGESCEVDGFEHLFGGGGVAAEFEHAGGAGELVFGFGDGFFEVETGFDEDGDADGGHWGLAFFDLGGRDVASPFGGDFSSLGG